LGVATTATSDAVAFGGASIVDAGQPFAISQLRRIFALCSRP
jgi:hypothetical protein